MQHLQLQNKGLLTFVNAIGNVPPGSTSPAKAAGYPGAFITGSVGYMDIGAVQRQEPTGGGGGTTPTATGFVS